MRAVMAARGSITPLALSYIVVALLVAMVVGAAGHLYLERKQLLALADATALAAVDSYDLDAVVLSAAHPTVRLDEQQVRVAAIDYVARHGERDIAVVDVAVAGNSVTVTLCGVWQAPIMNNIIPAEIELLVSASADSELH